MPFHLMKLEHGFFLDVFFKTCPRFCQLSLYEEKCSHTLKSSMWANILISMSQKVWRKIRWLKERCMILVALYIDDDKSRERKSFWRISGWSVEVFHRKIAILVLFLYSNRFPIHEISFILPTSYPCFFPPNPPSERKPYQTQWIKSFPSNNL